MLKTQKGIPDVGLTILKFPYKLHKMAKIFWGSELREVYCLDIFSPENQRD